MAPWFAASLLFTVATMLPSAARRLPCGDVTGPTYEATVITAATSGTDTTLELRDCDLTDTVVTVVRRPGDSTRTTPGTSNGESLHVLILIHNVTMRSVSACAGVLNAMAGDFTVVPRTRGR